MENQNKSSCESHIFKSSRLVNNSTKNSSVKENFPSPHPVPLRNRESSLSNYEYFSIHNCEPTIPITSSSPVFLYKSYLFGRECKLGWGYNSSSSQIIPIEGNAPNCQSVTSNSSDFGSLSNIACDNPPILKLAELIEEKCRKYLDFCILFDNQEYWIVNWYMDNKRDKSGQFTKYPLNCDGYVCEIDYSVDLRIIFSKQDLSDNSSTARSLLQNKNLDDTQKKIPCKLLINFNEIREMTLGECIQYIEEVQSKKNFLSEIPHFFRTRPLNTSRKPITINNSKIFCEFLFLLYYVFRKIEMKIEKIGYSNIIDVMSLEKELPLLEDAKDAYESMDKSDFSKMYNIIKQLFHCYVDYIEHSLYQNVDITEGDHLPGSVEELKRWLRELNDWSPEIYIITCPGYKHVIHKLHQTKKFNNCVIVNNDKITQPFISLNKENIPFGFVNMKGAESTKIPKYIPPLTRDCTDGCTQDLRKWICTECGEFILIKNWILYCSCGCKKYKDKELSCIHQYQCKWDLTNAPVLVTPPGYEQVPLKLRQTIKYAKIHIFEDPEVHEPYIGDFNEEEHLFGFVDMDGAKHQTTSKTSQLLQRTCPNDCTSDIRKWICTKCGEFVYFENWVLYCSCGSKTYNDEILICHHLTHGKILPVEIVDEWKKYAGPVLVTRFLNDEVIQKIHQTAKFKNIEVFEEPKATESFIGYEYGKKILFGFIDMTEAHAEEPKKNLQLFEIECPKECTKDTKRWICTTCGDFISSNNWLLYCSCGSKKYKEKFLFCYHPSHTQVSSSEVNTLRTQLEKLVLRKTDVDAKIPEAINVLSTSTDKTVIVKTLRELTGPFDGDTQNLIDQITSVDQS